MVIDARRKDGLVYACRVVLRSLGSAREAAFLFGNEEKKSKGG